jgi:cytidine deaminase
MDDVADPGTGSPLSPVDEELIERAQQTVAEAFDPEWFGGAPMVGAALRGESGSVYTGVSLPAGVGRASVCAEPGALSNAVEGGEEGLAASVAVRHPLPDEDRDFEVVSACGVCRELLYDFDPGVEILFPTTADPRKAPVEELLPTRHW